MCWKILRKQLKEKHFESFIQERKERQYKRCITEQNFKIKLQFHCGTGIVSGYFAVDATVWGTVFIWVHPRLNNKSKSKNKLFLKGLRVESILQLSKSGQLWGFPQKLAGMTLPMSYWVSGVEIERSEIEVHWKYTETSSVSHWDWEGRISKSPCTARLASWPYLHQNPPNLLLLSDFLSVLLNQM